MGSGTPHDYRGLPSLHLLPGRTSPGSPVDREEKEGPQGSEGEIELGATTFSGQKAGGLRPRAYAAPVEWVPSGIARVWGTREETRSSRGLRGRPRPGRRHCGTTFGRRRAGDRGERTSRYPSPCVPHPAPGASRPTPRAPRLACVPSQLHLARASKTLELESGVPQPGGFSSPRVGQRSAGPAQIQPGPAGGGLAIGGLAPRPPPSRSTPPRPFALPKAFICPYPVRSCSVLLFLSHSISPHTPLPSPFFLPSSPACPPPPGGAELLPSLLDNAVAARPLLPRPQVGAWAASASSGLRTGGGVERRG